jgi:hypothetical protein
MGSYLSEVKQRLEETFIDAFDRAWKEVVEPALKESYTNGLEAGRKPEDPSDKTPKRKSWSKRRE